MTSDEANEDFRHQYGDTLKAIKLDRYEIAAELKKNLAGVSIGQSREALDLQFERWDKLQDEIAGDLATEIPDAEIVLKKALRSLERVQAFRFLTENLLEGVKRDQSLNNTMENYRVLGLLPADFPARPEETKNSPWPSNWGVGGFLQKIMKGLKKLALNLMQLVINAMKAIPQLAELEIRPNIGMVGPFPALTVDFNLKAKGIAINELFETLVDGLNV
jgi:hypothetical protein